MDVLPTLLEAAGLQIPPQLQGQSLLPALQNRPFEGKGSALMEHHGWKNLRIEGFRYLVHADGSESLWDLPNDPHEYHDVASEPDLSSGVGGTPQTPVGAAAEARAPPRPNLDLLR